MYGGVQAAEKYGSVALGVGKDLGSLGAISLDATHARAKFADDTETGQSYRFCIQNVLTIQTPAYAWLAIVTPPKATIPSMNGPPGKIVRKISGKPETAAVVWKER